MKFLFGAFFFGGSNDDEALTRHTVTGTCNSRRCAGNRRTATRTTFRDRTVVVRCNTCKSAEDFVETEDEYNNPSKHTGADREEYRRDRSDFEDDTPGKQGRGKPRK